ncbi:MAG: hypothetical protein JWO93_652 [Micrococcaceae bacterium]|jgi:hypothetical protein|nr:hypothetical protein [Micrococcaceae bacterium]
METRTTLEAAYTAAGVTPSAEELERWSHRYGQARAAADTLFDLPEVKYEDLAVVFRAR